MENICDLMSGILFNILLSCVLLLALSLFSLNQSIVLNVRLAANFNLLVVYLMACYIYSYFSEVVTTNSFKIGDDAYNSLWNEMPVKQQKLIILIISRSQKEFRLRGLGMIDCSLAKFLAVMSIDQIIFQSQ